MDTNLENTWVLQKFKTAPKTVEGLRQLLGFIDIIAHILIFFTNYETTVWYSTRKQIKK